MKTAYRLDFGTVSAMSALSLCLATPYSTRTVFFSNVFFQLVEVRLDRHLPKIVSIDYDLGVMTGVE